MSLYLGISRPPLLPQLALLCTRISSDRLGAEKPIAAARSEHGRDGIEPRSGPRLGEPAPGLLAHVVGIGAALEDLTPLCPGSPTRVQILEVVERGLDDGVVMSPPLGAPR